jgi:hypothetical protein
MCPAMQDNSSKFISNMQQLQDSVSKYVAAIDQQVLMMTPGHDQKSLPWPADHQYQC